MKRGAEVLDEVDGDSNGAQTPGEGIHRNKVQAFSDEDDDDLPVLQAGKRASQVRKGHECPYLDTVSRQVGLPARSVVQAPLLLTNTGD